MIMKKLVFVLLTSSKYSALYWDFNKAFDFSVLRNFCDFHVDLLHEYLTFQVSYAKVPVMLTIYEHSTHNNKQFGGCLVKIKQLLGILQGF